MFRKKCAHNSIAALPQTGSERTVLNERIFYFALAIVLVTLVPAIPASAADEKAAGSAPPQPTSASGSTKPKSGTTAKTPPKETTQIVVAVSVNMESKGDFFVEIDDEGNLFLKTGDLNTLKLKFSEDRSVLIHDERYVPASAVLDAKPAFDEKNLALSFIGKTTVVQKTSSDIFSLQSSTQNVYYPRETSAFLNYGLNYAYTSAEGFQSFMATNKLGIRSGDVFFTSDSQYTKTEFSQSFVRLQSSATYERRGDLQWLVLGDQFTNSGDLGSTVNMGGIGFSKVYKIDPYLITQPVFDLKGTTAFPSQAEIYLDGVLVGRQSIAPGSFELKNIYSYTGSHMVNVVLKDPFGNEQRISYPLYINTQLLREGLHEYSYNVGFLRERYGVESNDYGKAAFSAFHRYGVTSAFNIGGRAEGSDDVYNGGISAALLVSRAGMFTLSVAESSAKGKIGSAGSFLYSYQISSFNTNALLRGFSRNYATVGSILLSDSTKYETSLAVGFLLDPVGTFTLGYASTEMYSGADTRVTSVSYSRALSRMTSLYATASSTQSVGTTNAVFITLNINFDWNLHGSMQYSRTGDANSETVQLQRDTPIGEGVGYRASLNRSDTGKTITSSLNPFVQYNARYGTYALDAIVQNTSGVSSESYNLSAAGSFVYAGGFFGLSRPVSDSFGFVMVDNVPGAAVLDNGQVIGKTDSSGRMIVPTLTSYSRNQITLETKNIPIDYSISDVNRMLSPSLWSGSCVAFAAKQVRALTGVLYVQKDDKKTPLEYVDIVIKVDGREVSSPTGKGGEFYLENTLPEDPKAGVADNLSCRAIAERKKSGANAIGPGTYNARVDYEGGTCEFSVTFPTTEDVITDIGEVVCKPVKKPTSPRAAPREGPVQTSAPPVPSPAPPSTMQTRIQYPPVPSEKPNILSNENRSPTIVVRPRINFDVPFEPSRRPYTRTNVGDLTMLLVKCGGETSLIFSNVGDNIINNVCPDQGTITEVLTRNERESLSAVVQYLFKSPGTAVEIEGHADRHGTGAGARRTGIQLASIVKEYLSRMGVKADQIKKVESLGRKAMLCTEETAACDAMNRRVVIRVVQEAATAGASASERTPAMK